MTYAVVDVQMFDRLLVVGYVQVQVDVGVDKAGIFSAHRENRADAARARAPTHTLLSYRRRSQTRSARTHAPTLAILTADDGTETTRVRAAAISQSARASRVRVCERVRRFYALAHTARFRCQVVSCGRVYGSAVLVAAYALFVQIRPTRKTVKFSDVFRPGSRGLWPRNRDPAYSWVGGTIRNTVSLFVFREIHVFCCFFFLPFIRNGMHVREQYNLI